jgi:hypothetical protein
VRGSEITVRRKLFELLLAFLLHPFFGIFPAWDVNWDNKDEILDRRGGGYWEDIR